MKTGSLEFMWRIVSVFSVSAFLLTGAARVNEGPVRYYVQLVRGTNSSQPPQADSRPVGAKLARTFEGVLKWRNYWEICRREVEIAPGRARKVSLANGRAVEIDLTQEGKRTVTAFQNGRVVDRTIRPVGESMTLIGGDRDQQSIWFIVVRRDRPGE